MSNEFFYIKYLKEELARRCESNPRYSLRAFARALGFEATVISQILALKRVPSLKLAERLLQNLSLEPKEQERFLNSLAEAHRSRSLKKFHRTQNTGRVARPTDLSLELFRVISDWYHYSILALSLTEGFQSDVKWIASQLKITETEAKLAIDRLISLNLLSHDAGELKCTHESLTTADKQITNSALKRHQKQILEKALFSLENDPISERDMSSMTMAIDPDRLPEAKLKIQRFTQELSEFLEGGKKKQVYQIGIALFPVQQKQENRK